MMGKGNITITISNGQNIQFPQSPFTLWTRFINLITNLMPPSQNYLQLPMQKASNRYLKVFCMVALLCPLRFAYAEIHGTVTGTTNYVWRMYSKNNGEPAIQGNLDYQHSSGIYLGASASNFNLGKSEQDEELTFPGSAQVEVSPYIGWSYKFADDWRMDLQYSRYIYDGTIYTFSGDYNEFYFFLHYKDYVSVQASYIDNYYGQGGDAYFYELTGRYPLTDYLEFSSTFGYARLKDALEADYPYWNVGFTGRYKFLALDLRYHDAREIYYLDANGQAAITDHPETLVATVVLSLSVGF
jgi:uncharacterized protein (TIGR02001 family)